MAGDYNSLVEHSVQPPRGESAQRALIELAEAAGAGASLAEVLDRVARAAATLVPGALVHVWLTGEDEREIRLATETGARPGRTGVEMARRCRWAKGSWGRSCGVRSP